MLLLGEASGGIMRHDMGTLRVDVEIENSARPGEKRTLNAVLVDTGAELSWVPSAILESLGVERNNKWLLRLAEWSDQARSPPGTGHHRAVGCMVGEYVALRKA